jgi:signal recognition particle subunit SEC65
MGKGRNVPPSNAGKQPNIEEAAAFLRDAGFVITEKGNDA